MPGLYETVLVIGALQVVIENHRGIVEYSPKRVVLADRCTQENHIAFG